MAPRIFTLLRSPVTETSGGQPTRLQVACRVESCRKLASSVKISAQCRAGAFFGSDRCGGASGSAPRHRRGPEYGADVAPKIPTHAATCVHDRDDTGCRTPPRSPRRCPDAVVQSVSHRTAVQNISQLLLLLVRQFRGPARPIALQQAVDSMDLIALEPLGHLRSRCLENSRQLTAALAFRVQHDRLQSFRHAIGSVAFGLFAESY